MIVLPHSMLTSSYQVFHHHVPLAGHATEPAQQNFDMAPILSTSPPTFSLPFAFLVEMRAVRPEKCKRFWIACV